MELHHNTHVHEKKKWKEYLFEIFMMFLSVFAGFLAENLREHYIEQQRTKEYALSLADDLKKDNVYRRK